MFKNRKLEIKLVKDTATPTVETAPTGLTKEDISDLTKDLLTKVVVGTVAIVGSVVVLNTLSSVTLLTVNHALSKNV